MWVTISPEHHIGCIASEPNAWGSGGEEEKEEEEEHEVEKREKNKNMGTIPWQPCECKKKQKAAGRAQNAIAQRQFGQAIARNVN